MIFLGKLFFRDEPPWQQQKSLATFLWILGVAAVVGGLVIAYALVQHHQH
jgi:hypothetical protein